MNWMLFRQSQNAHKQLEQTEVGRRLLEIQEEGRKVLERNVWWKELLVALIFGAIAGLITYMSSPANTVGNAFITSLIVWCGISCSKCFIKANEKSNAFQAIQSEFINLIDSNEKEREIVKYIMKLG